MPDFSRNARFILSLFIALFYPWVVIAAEDLAEACGEPPPVADEELKGEIDGQARFLSGFLGGAALSGQIEIKRNEVFSKYSPGERSNAYFEYQVCVLLMRDTELSVKEKLFELNKVREGFSKPLSVFTDENELFLTRVVSAAKSPSRDSLIVSVMIESKVGYEFLMAQHPPGALGVDDGGDTFKHRALAGIAGNSFGCSKNSSFNQFTLITPNSKQSVVFELRRQRFSSHEERSDGEIISFSADFCIKSGDKIFLMPIGISNIRTAQSGSPDTSDVSAPQPAAPARIASSDGCTPSKPLKKTEWAEYKAIGSQFSFSFKDQKSPCFIVHSDSEGEKKACPNQRTEVNANQKLWFRAEDQDIPEANICFNGLEFVRYCVQC